YDGMKTIRLVEVFEDPGISGGKPLGSRPVGSRLLTAAKRTKVSVVVAKLDCLFRSMVIPPASSPTLRRNAFSLWPLPMPLTWPARMTERWPDGLGVRRIGTRHDSGADTKRDEREAVA